MLFSNSKEAELPWQVLSWLQQGCPLAHNEPEEEKEELSSGRERGAAGGQQGTPWGCASISENRNLVSENRNFQKEKRSFRKGLHDH